MRNIQAIRVEEIHKKSNFCEDISRKTNNRKKAVINS
jgi:hypothetical protein